VEAIMNAPPTSPLSAAAKALLLAAACALATPAAPAPAAAPPPAPADPQRDAQAFVQSYADVVTGENLEVVSHWIVPLCVRVTGLEPEQEAAVGTRVVQVAQGLRLAVGRVDSHAKARSGCFGRGVNVEIEFTDYPQVMPVRVTYQTSTTLSAINAAPGGGLAAERGSNGLKILADYQYQAPIVSPGQGGPPPGSAPGGGPSAAGIYFNPPGPPSPHPPSLRTHTITIGIRGAVVIVDKQRVRATQLGALADYGAMLVLSQPRALDHCQALPSVTDLFAGPCPGRAAPAGLTPADNAYLSALYLYRGKPGSASAPQVMVGPRKLAGAIPTSELADRMAANLAGPGAVADSQGRPAVRGF
jgi:hypothetical protein